MQQALGLIETVGYAPAISAADAAVKAANVEITAIEKIIGVQGGLGVTVHFSGDVASVKAAVEAGERAGRSVGKVVSAHVIPRAHQEVSEKLLSRFKLKTKESSEPTSDDQTDHHDSQN
ncbi:MULTISPECIES: BMC domain-containing protein [unclassified Bacillus (in: firmicutes)]|uniref:BMC domain-containing protein n=1 Tax=unclassified Bacillus (in: firmicutes) TaxID=185979 RepID=UPI0008E57268|nr:MULTISPECIES: BMC domain-containing protein [unclassified Bacillus (in: firmicutes)]SFB02251.1 BMC domain-containing protein [Bacillus sp. UNCCL13]SFQ89125.1 BMC domain-containing protein [Bacillus sp. cl95]